MDKVSEEALLKFRAINEGSLYFDDSHRLQGHSMIFEHSNGDCGSSAARTHRLFCM